MVLSGSSCRVLLQTCREYVVLAVSGSTASSALVCFLAREPPNSTQWTMVKISWVSLMFGISSLVVFLANWVPEFLQGWDILEINANFVEVHRMLSIINTQGTAERTAGALLSEWESSVLLKVMENFAVLFWCWVTWSLCGYFYSFLFTFLVPFSNF